MGCVQCDSKRILHIKGKCNDLCTVRYLGKSRNGYVPENIGIGGGNYVEFELCVECGRLQYHFPILEEQLEGEFPNE